jgi:hypothetical protein
MNRVDLGLLANDALILGVGYAFVFALGLVRSGVAALKLVGLSYLAGWALLGTLLSLGLMAGVPLELSTVLIVAGVTAIACAFAGRRVQPVPEPPPRPRQGRLALTAAIVGGAVIAIASLAAIVTSIKSEWDPNLDLLTAWLPRSGIIYYLHHIDPSRWATFLDPWYPPLAPTMYATTYEFAGGAHPSLLMFQQALLGVAFVLALAAVLDRVAPRWLTLPTLALLITAPWFWWRLTSLLPDQTLAYMIATAGVTSLLWLHERRAAWLGLATVFLSAATLVKLEGLAFSLVLAVAVIAAGFAVHRRGALPALVLLLGPLAAVPWRAWLDTHSVAATNSQLNTSHLLDPGFLVHRIHRLTYAIDFMLSSPWKGGDYRTAAIVVIAIFVAVLAARQVPVLTITVAVWLVLSFFALAATYWAGAINLQFYVTTSASRVGAVIIVSAAAVTPLLLGLALRREAQSEG